MLSTSVNVVRPMVATTIIVLMVMCGSVRAATPSLAFQFGSVKSDASYAIATDNDGNIFVAGDYSGNLSPNCASQDGFVRKMDRTGALLWQTLISTTAYDEIRGMVVDKNDGSVYVCGNTKATGFGGQDLFVAKLSSSGVILWQDQSGTSLEDAAYAITIDASGYVYISGSTMGSMDGVRNPTIYRDCLVMKYAPTGQHVWVKQFCNSLRPLNNVSYAIAYYSNMIYVTGVNGANGNENLFINAIDTNGNMVWKRGIGPENTIGRGIVVDATGVYVCGVFLGYGAGFDGYAPFGGTWDSLLIKYDLDGNKLWSKVWGTTASDCAYSIVRDSSGNVYVAGLTNATMLDSQASNGGCDAYVMKFDSNGARINTKMVGTAFIEYCYAVALDPIDNIIMTGLTAAPTTGKVYDGADVFVTVYPSETGSSVSTMTVMDQDTLAPLADTLVTAYDANNMVIGCSTTDANGKTVFKTRNTAKLVATKDKTGYTSVITPETFVVNPGYNKFSTYMTPVNNGFWYTVIVVDKSKTPISGVNVTIVDTNGAGTIGTFVTNSKGIVKYWMPKSGKTTFTLTKSGYAKYTVIAVVNRGAKNTTTITMQNDTTAAKKSTTTKTTKK